MLTYNDLNAQLNMPVDGAINIRADRQAARAYHLEVINPHTRFFHTLEEKVRYMLDQELWNKATVEMYDFEKFKALFKRAHAHKFRFKTLLGAMKFYEGYALRESTQDEEGRYTTTYLERFEDRVVMTAIHLSEGDYRQAQDLVDIIIDGRFQPATPTFLNAGRAKGGEMVSCFLLRVEDNMESIGRAVNSSLQLSKRGGGVGLLLTNLREMSAPIKNIPGTSSGVVPVMKMLEDAFSYANQLGQRQGAGAVYLNAHHPDIMTFLDTKRENADEKIRIKTLSLGVVIPDITFHLAKDNKDMYLFSPYDVERIEGKPFADLSVTENYDKWVEDPRITKKKIKARAFFRTLSELQFESGYPYVMFEDTANKFHTMKHAGRINMSNLCVTGDTEILTSKGYRKVIDLYESQEDIEVIVDERARTMDLNSKGTSVQQSTRMFKTAENAEIYKVKTSEGFELKATEWHKFYVDRDGELVKIPLNQLVPGDRLLTQGGESIESPEEDGNADLAYLMGVWAAEGTFVKGSSAKLALYGDKEQFADHVQQKIHNALDGREDLLQRQATLTPEFRPYILKNPKVEINSAPLFKLFGENGFGAENKVSVPHLVKEGGRGTKAEFINGVWQMDGCITGNEKVGNISIELGSIHLDFLQDMQKLLLEFGIYSRIYTGKKVGGLALLPDGQGGMKSYYQSKSWTLRVTDRYSREMLHDLVSWKDETEAYWKRRCANIKSDKYYNTHKFRATVESIEFVGNEDVYDVTVDNGNSVIFNGLATGQCSEIQQLNTPSVLNDDLTYDTVGADISCNLGSLNVKKMLDLTRDEFVDTVQVAVRALTVVSTMTNIDSVPSVREGNSLSRAIGLGQMNLHGALAHHGLRYGSEEALKLWDNYMALVTWAAMCESAELAREIGETPYFDGSEYATGEWWDRVPKAHLERAENLEILPGLEAPDADDWNDLHLKISQYGMANAYLQTIPPTGSISYINNSTSSIHPIVNKVETRKEGKVGRVYYPAPHMRSDNLHLYEDAYEIGPERVIDTYAVSQQWVDQSQSLTLFFPDTATTRDLDKARIYAWRKGIRTMYYVRLRQMALDGTGVTETGVAECESCLL